METITAKINNGFRDFKVLNNPTVGSKKLSGDFIKVANAYCPIDDLCIKYNCSVDEWMKDKLN